MVFPSNKGYKDCISLLLTLGWMNLLVSQVTERTDGLSRTLCLINFSFIPTNQWISYLQFGRFLSSGASLSRLPADLHRGQKRMNQSVPSWKVWQAQRPCSHLGVCKVSLQNEISSISKLWRPLWLKKKRKEEEPRFCHESKTHYGNTLNLLTIHGICLQTTGSFQKGICGFSDPQR